MQSLYIPRESAIHTWHPLTKLAAFVLVVTLTSTLPAPATALIVCLAIVALAAAAGVAQPILRVTLAVLTPLFLSLVIIQGVLFPPTRTMPLLDLGWFTLWGDGLLFALRIASRLLAVALTVLLLVTTTHPADLIQSLTELGLPRSIGHILLVALQLVPDMSARATAILEAQRSRGLETSGMLRRLRALPSLVGPLIVGALADVEERAMALESRAFAAPGPKTTLRALRDTGPQRAARALLLALAAAAVVARLTILRGSA